MHLLRIWDPRHPPSNPFFKSTLGTVQVPNTKSRKRAMKSSSLPQKRL